MHNKERELEILNILKKANGFVSTKQLCQMLFASESSIRRDLRALEEQKLVKISHCGIFCAILIHQFTAVNHITQNSFVGN